jgi:hypothetical protein
MFKQRTRRQVLQDLGLSAAAAPFLLNLPSLGLADTQSRPLRLILVFSPNGIIPPNFWPDETGTEFAFKEILAPLESFRDRVLILHGISNQVRGDGDNHMRGMSCLLTGIELFPGNIQGGSHTPAGWPSGISIDQELRNFLQGQPATQTRFGSLEFGVAVPNRADPWTRMVYAGPNQPVAPIDDPYQMFEKLYGQLEDQESLQSILDRVRQDLRSVRSTVNPADQRLLDEHESLVRQLERDLQAARNESLEQYAPELPGGVKNQNDNIPQLSQMQIDLLVSSFLADQARVATLQYTNSVGQARMRWLGIEEAHHELSHEPDSNEDAQQKLTQINRWFCDQIAYLAKRLSDIPEPGGEGSLLDHTLIVWTNELGKGNSHTLDNIPFVLLGSAPQIRMGRSLQFDRVPHNRLWLTLAHLFGHPLEHFGKPEFCRDGVLTELT